MPESGGPKDIERSVHFDAQGVLTSDRVVTLGLRGTEGKHFIAEGDLYPAKEPTPFTNGQVYFTFATSRGT